MKYTVKVCSYKILNCHNICLYSLCDSHSGVQCINNTYYNDTVTYKCNEGLWFYRGVTQSTIKCQANKFWTKPPECVGRYISYAGNILKKHDWIWERIFSTWMRWQHFCKVLKKHTWIQEKNWPLAKKVNWNKNLKTMRPWV